VEDGVEEAEPGACITRAKELAAPRRVDPTRRSFHRRVEARDGSDGSVLGGDMTVVTGSIRWTGELSDRADVAARGGAVVERGGAWKDGQNLLGARDGAWKL
jgi:hypothetical protein